MSKVNLYARRGVAATLLLSAGVFAGCGGQSAVQHPAARPVAPPASPAAVAAPATQAEPVSQVKVLSGGRALRDGFTALPGTTQVEDMVNDVRGAAHGWSTLLEFKGDLNAYAEAYKAEIAAAGFEPDYDRSGTQADASGKSYVFRSIAGVKRGPLAPGDYRPVTDRAEMELVSTSDGTKTIHFYISHE